MGKITLPLQTEILLNLVHKARTQFSLPAVHGELRFSLSIYDGEMAATALVVLEGTPLRGQQTFQFAGIHERHIAVIIDDSNKNVAPGSRNPADGSDPMRPAVDFELRVHPELTMDLRTP
jgi:hypothetical protein